MASIKIEAFNWLRHRNPMANVDNAQGRRYFKAPTLHDYKVCRVTVCSFTFIFHSVEQLRLCLDFYRREHQPSSRLPVETENLGGDHGETQRWFEQLPMFLLEKPKRTKVVKALEQALAEYSAFPSANTGTQTKDLYNGFKRGVKKRAIKKIA